MSGFGDRINLRQKNFKKGVDADEARRKREDTAVQLRKQVREEALQKKRQTEDDASTAQAMPMLEPNTGCMVEAAPSVGSVVTGQFVQMLGSPDPQVQFKTTQHFRKMLSVEKDPPIQDVINAGVVPRFIHFLRDTSRPELQFEAAWVLTNIASGSADQTRFVVENGALPIFVELLMSPSEDVREQAVWALGNIAGDSPNFRDLVLQSGALQPVMNVLSGATKISVVRNATWALSNFCRGKPPPPLEWVSPAFPTLVHLISTNDREVLTDSCWALSYLSDGTSDRINAVIQAGVLPRLVELLGHNSPLVQTPALRALGNVVSGEDAQTQEVLKHGALPVLGKLLSHEKKAIRKETCWTISNITAGNQSQIQAVIDAGFIPPLVQVLEVADFDVKKEAAWAISNVGSAGTKAQVEFLITCNCIKPMVDLLLMNDIKISSVTLDFLLHILKVGKAKQQDNGLADNPCCALIEQADGLTKIEALQTDVNQELSDKATHLLEAYFPLEDDGYGMGDGAASELGGADPAQQQFQFGAPVPQGGFTFGNSPM
eukprot:TRINITY_DN27727_c0_g1_i1.p1 TRINITY_DN27727_c0_g1~~TRINITY_DN27727_c0_g1_i1.p1  ORF type:complete len:558 (+),score=124.32 TRINITY_DN27727_c0_g1_i1:37-1674(+)